MEITLDHSLRLWWVFIVRGLLFIALGIYLFAEPASGFVALGFSFGLIILLAGIAELLRAYRDYGRGNRGWHLFTGLVDLLLGLILMSHLAASLVVLRIIIGFYFLFKGITVLAFRKHGNAAVLVMGAIVILLFVGMIWFNPVFGSMTVLVWTAMAFLVTGVLNVMLGLRLRPKS